MNLEKYRCVMGGQNHLSFKQDNRKEEACPVCGVVLPQFNHFAECMWQGCNNHALEDSAYCEYHSSVVDSRIDKKI